MCRLPSLLSLCLLCFQHCLNYSAEGSIIFPETDEYIHHHVNKALLPGRNDCGYWLRPIDKRSVMDDIQRNETENEEIPDDSFDLFKCPPGGYPPDFFTIAAVGGVNAVYTPWMVRLGYKSNATDEDVDFRCAGSLINNRYVLTAAHCFPDGRGADQVSVVRLGEHDTSTNPDCSYIYTNRKTADPVVDIPVNSSHFFIHPEYNRPYQFSNDIALIRLPIEVPFSEWVRPVCLPLDTEDDYREELVATDPRVTGWGLDEFASFPEILQEVSLPLFNKSECKIIYSGLNTPMKISDESQICLGGELGRDSCRGDSGGPATLWYEERTTVVGIVSFGPTTCSGKIPGIYTWVPKYMSWILDTIFP